MKLIRTLKQASFRSWWRLVTLGFRHPHFIVPTYRATRDTMTISTDYFGNAHFKNGVANAFRHALWNYLIAINCSKKSNNQEKVLGWTKRITDWHEEAFKNRPLARFMDFHNNKIGRELFKKHETKGRELGINALLQMIENAEKINKVPKEMPSTQNLIYVCE